MKGGSIKRAIIVLFASLILASPPTWAFTDGSGWAAVTYLIKLVEQSIRHYQQLQMMIQYSKDAQSYMHEILFNPLYDVDRFSANIYIGRKG